MFLPSHFMLLFLPKYCVFRLILFPFCYPGSSLPLMSRVNLLREFYKHLSLCISSSDFFPTNPLIICISLRLGFTPRLFSLIYDKTLMQYHVIGQKSRLAKWNVKVLSWPEKKRKCVLKQPRTAAADFTVGRFTAQYCAKLPCDVM